MQIQTQKVLIITSQEKKDLLTAIERISNLINVANEYCETVEDCPDCPYCGCCIITDVFPANTLKDFVNQLKIIEED